MWLMVKVGMMIMFLWVVMWWMIGVSLVFWLIGMCF